VEAAAHRWSPRIRVPLPRRSTRLAIAAFVVLAILGLLARPAYDAFRSPLADTANLNTRLLSPSGRGRADYWRVAWKDAKDHPVLGSGAGSFQVRWLRDRPNAFDVLDAHELYLETLAEVGLVGLALLVLALAVPLLALRQARGQWEAGAAAAYASYLIHAAADWDWELPTVTLTALACGCVLLVAARPHRPVPPMPGLVRAGAFTAAAAVAVVTGMAYLASNALTASFDALRVGNFSTAESQARRARSLQPWSPAPWTALGDAQLAAGDAAAALASYRRAVDKDPQNWLLWYLIARNSHGSERAAAIEAGLRLNPRSPELAALRRS
jgi:tetratricopeptide (TPR) repeat protein